MPRCFTIRKHSAQHNSIQPQSRKIASSSSDEKNSEHCDGKKPHRKVAVIQRASTRTTTKKPQAKSKNTINGGVGGSGGRILREPSDADSILNRSNRSNSMNGEWKSTIMQRKKLMNSTNAAAQQQTKATGPTSPTEATIAPIYYNGSNTNDSRNGGVIISSKTNEFERLSYGTRDNYQPSNYSEKSTDFVRCDAVVNNPMSINIKHDSSMIIANDSMHQTNNSVISSHQMSSAIVYKPTIQSVIQSTNSNGNISSPIIGTIETPPFTPISRSNPNSDSGNYLKESSSTQSNQYFVLRSTADSSAINSQPSIYRERSIEETEAAHDLLSLSQSLPPLPAPCVVTILHPVTNYNVSSPDVQEITPSRPSKEYITYTSGRTIQCQSERTDIHTRNKKNVSTQFDADMLPDDSSSSDINPQITPLTPPTSESSSSDVEFISEAVTTGSSETSSSSSSSSSSSPRTNGQNGNQKSQKSKSAQVFGMTIFDAVMINDGRSKKGNGDAEVIHIEERRKGRYKCPQCGKQYATSSNLSRHKQTHRSLDSQSAKKCNTCGKAYVSMPALAMHLLTHKLTHSCDVCGKLFSRPWLLQGHLRSHTGEKPYGCAHCGKAFADRSNLRAHMQTHSLNKQFECTKCQKTFALKSYLNKHLESSCLREEFKKSYDSKKKSDSMDNTTDISMDDDTIDVTQCSPNVANSVDDYDEDDEDEDIIVT